MQKFWFFERLMAVSVGYIFPRRFSFGDAALVAQLDRASDFYQPG